MSNDTPNNVTDVLKNSYEVTYPWHETESWNTMRLLWRNLWPKKKCTDFQQIIRLFDHVQAAEMSKLNLLLLSWSCLFPTRFNSVTGLESLHVPRVADQSVSTSRLHISTQICLGCRVTFGTYPAHRKTLAACNKTGYRASCKITNCNRNRTFLLGSRTLGGQHRTFIVF
jgi:hypothetical protein